MIVLRLRNLLMIFVILTFTACSNQPIIKYVDKPYEVKVPVKCVVRDANCSFNKPTYTGVINSMLECITIMKHNEKACQ